MKILTGKQIKEADQFTIKHEPVSSIDLMERAVEGLFERISDRCDRTTVFEIFCGKGNNGGDGLGLARKLAQNGYQVRAVIIEHSDNSSEDFQINLERLQKTNVQIAYIRQEDDWTCSREAVMVDAILGSGLSRPLEGFVADVVQGLNRYNNFKIAIDIPTGLFADDNSNNQLDKIFRSDWCLSIEFPKLSMMHKDTAPLCGEVSLVDIKLHPRFIGDAKSKNYYVQYNDACSIFKPRKKHSYKGTYGNALLLAGSRGSIGAAIMSATGCLRSGAGLLTVATPACGVDPVQTALPEAMVKPDENSERITQLPDLSKATAVGAGPGLGTADDTAQVIKHLIQNLNVPVVFDADALNILSANKTWLSFLPANSVLTPHPGEFKRLLGVDKLEQDYIDRLRQFSQKNNVVTVLKDSITAVADRQGRIFFIDEGSPALASPGSGDVLTGIILGLLSSGYQPLQAALLGVYLQGRAGKLAGELYSLESALARDVIENLGLAFSELYS